MQPQETFNYTVVRQFALMTVVWGIVGMLVGVLVAAQLTWPELNLAPWLSYGRLRPLHTNAVIFAFGGSALFATSYYVVQRTCHVRLFSDTLASFTFWGWQVVIVAAAITLPLGITTSKEYAELEWPIDILITLVWVAYAIVFFGTIAKRRTPHIYVANWFYGAFILTVALLHVVNSAEIPVTLWKSYPVYAGVQDAMVQWWYGHNAVGFFLTAGFLGIMYYFVPKQAGRPIYSYRLSVVHFWALIFTYMWAGPHHLHYTALPDWAQSLGMLFSLILLAPSWGGMINGIMTLSGAWYKLRDDPILKFLISQVPHRLALFLRHVHARRPDDVDQDGQCAFALHGLDHRPRAFGGARMGRPHFHRRALLPDSAALRAHANGERRAHHASFLGGNGRHRALHRCHVDRRRHAGTDVARGKPGWNADLHLRRVGQGDLSVLRHPFARRHALPRGHADHGLQRLEDGGRAACGRRNHTGCCCRLKPLIREW